jgi:hypothetical protein
VFENHWGQASGLFEQDAAPVMAMAKD